MKRRTRRRLVLLAILLAVLALLGLWFVNYQRTKSLSIDLTVKPADVLVAPQYMYAFSGPKGQHLAAPVGIVATDGVVYVADSAGMQLFEFKQDGTFIKTFGKKIVFDPVYLAINPKDGLLYVTDRSTKKIQKFKLSGEYVGEFDPNLPKAERPTFKAPTVWSPIAITFAPDGAMFVTDILKDQRILKFAPDGTFERSFGTQGVANTASDIPGKLQFPNSLKVLGDELWVADSNNRRIQIYTLDGEYKRLIPLSGLPRGLVFLPQSAAISKGKGTVFAVVDTLTSFVALYSTSGAPSVTFGEKGPGTAQFLLPNDITVGDKTILFVTDTSNMRVQAWGWPSETSIIPAILPQQPAWCLLALPLLLIPLFFRRKKYFATEDFIAGLAAAQALEDLKQRRVRWLVSEQAYENLKDVPFEERTLGEFLVATEYSDTDARALSDRYGIALEQAALLTSARRTRLFGTENDELRGLAKMLEIEVVNVAEYRERFGTKPPSVEPES